MPLKILKTKEVTARVGYSRVWLWELERKGEFPRHVKVGPNRIGWLEHEIDEWISKRADAREPEAQPES